MPKIILASTSPRRKELLSNLGLKFKCVPSDYEEEMNLPLPPLKLAKYLSLQKAKAVAKKYPNDIIIAADTIVVYKNKVLGKPHTQTRAKSMLKELSGSTHEVITGFTVLSKDKTISQSLATEVYFKKLTSREINNYVKTGDPLDKAGAYAIQTISSIFIKKIEGDYFNIVGLPLYPLSQVLKKFNINIL